MIWNIYMKSCSGKQWEKTTDVINTHLRRAGWNSQILPFVLCLWSLLKHQVTMGMCSSWPYVPRLIRLSNLSAVAAESIYLLNCHLVHWRVGKVLSRGYRIIRCKSAWSLTFASSRIFTLVHDGDLALKRDVCCRSTFCPLNNETLATCFGSKQLFKRLMQQPWNLVINLKHPVSGWLPHKIRW